MDESCAGEHPRAQAGRSTIGHGYIVVCSIPGPILQDAGIDSYSSILVVDNKIYK